MVYPTTTSVTIADDCVSFINGRRYLKIYADRTVWQEDLLELARYNPETKKMEPFPTPIPCPEESGGALEISQCRCGLAWQPSPVCLSLSNEQVFVHLHPDHISVYGDRMLDLPIIFDMVEPASMETARAKVAELLHLDLAPIQQLSPAQLEQRLDEFRTRRAASCISFTFGGDGGTYLKPIQ
jgi:hypothetical protein